MLVKSKAKQYEIKDLLKNELSKMEHLDFDKLEMTKYLELDEITLTKANAVFQFRSRMANFKDNYRGTNPYNICPLCLSHPDTQQAAFHCSVIRKSIEVHGKLKYSDILDGNISKDLATTVKNILKIGETSLLDVVMIILN